MKTLYLTTFLILIFLSANGQFEIKKGQLKASYNEYLNGRLNDIVTLEDIYYPDKNFNCLKPLGAPEKIIESHTKVGDEYTFYFPGLILAYHNTNPEQQMSLAFIEITSPKSFIRLLNNKSLQPDQKINNIVDTQNLKMDIKDTDVLIPFQDFEGSKIILKTNSGKISTIKIWFD